MIILANDGLDKDAIIALEEKGFTIDANHYEGTKFINRAINSDILVVRSATKVYKDTLDKFENTRLKLIIRAGVGMDNIDVAYARTKGIATTNTPNSNTNSVAELVIGQIIVLSRFINITNITMRAGKWEKSHYEGNEITGKILGLVGMGRIGKLVANKASALGMKVQYFDDYVDLYGDYKKVDFKNLIQTSDFITLHVPSQDKPLFTINEFRQMKKTSFIINTARGNIIEENDLLEALNTGLISGSALDVFANEPNKNLELVNHPKVSVTPHIGGSTVEAQQKIGNEVVEIIENFGGQYDNTKAI